MTTATTSTLSRVVFVLAVVCSCWFLNAVSGMDVLLVMVDNRKLTEMTENDYFRYTAPINYVYAKKYGYDFAVINFDTSNVVKLASERYGTNAEEAKRQEGYHLKAGWASPSKQQSAVYHPGLKQFRATPWAKLPVLWNISLRGLNNKMYDHVFYLDSDFVINPKYHSRSFPDLFHGWSLPDAVTR
jgi:hypothetical protein